MILIKNKIDFRIHVLIIGILVATFSWFAIERVKTTMVNKYVNNETEKELLLTQDSAKILELEFKDLEEKLNLVVYTTEIQNQDQKNNNCVKDLSNILSLFHNRVNALIRIDKNEKVACSTTGFPANADVSTNPNVQEVFRTKKLTLGRVIYGAASGRYVISLVAPIYKNGNFDGALSGTIFLDQFRDSYIAGYGVYGYGNMLIIDDNGDIINHYIPELIGKNRFSDEVNKNSKTRPYTSEIIKLGLSGKSDNVVRELNGNQEYVSFAPVKIFPERTWVVISIARHEDITSRINQYFTVRGYNVYILYHILALTITTLATSLFIISYTIRKKSNLEA